ncbi:MAG: tetraacyldisaccharide 4'-kinase [Acidobacteria bacterium]|nr:tetraacyldisaccharide 4'-kinase [Acidobacteriota bacterium]
MSPARPIPALAPLGCLYLRAAALRNALFDRGAWRAERAAAPVLSIGNLVAGGTGKTPAAAWLSALLAGEGRRVAIVSRGHGGVRASDPLLVRDGGAPRATAREAGDEPYLLAAEGAAPIVVVGRRRTAAAALACAAGADAIVLDDGFQHRWLARDLDVVLLDAADPFGGGRGLPAGLLREPPAGLARAGLVVLTRAPAAMLVPRPLERAEWPAALAALEATLRARGAELPQVVAAAHEPATLALPDGRMDAPSALAGRDLVVVSGIARPDAFAATLEGLGGRIAARLDFADHHRYGAADARAIVSAAERVPGSLVVTTAKDANRWPAGAPVPAVLRIAFRVPAEQAVRAVVRRALFPGAA